MPTTPVAIPAQCTRRTLAASLRPLARNENNQADDRTKQKALWTRRYDPSTARPRVPSTVGRAAEPIGLRLRGMRRSIKYAIRRALTLLAASCLTQQRLGLERQALLIGRLLAETVTTKQDIRALSEVEFTVFSQFGDDGLIQWLCRSHELCLRG